MSNTTASATINAPVQYVLTDNSGNTYNIFVVLDSAQENLYVIDNFSWGTFNYMFSKPIPLTTNSSGFYSGAAQSIAIEAANPQFTVENNLPFGGGPQTSAINNGTLYFSAYNYNGVDVIALYLDASSANCVKVQNGDGIYLTSELAVKNPYQYENSVQNAFNNIVPLVVNVVSVAASTYAGGWAGLAASLGTNGGQIVQQLQKLTSAITTATGASIGGSVPTIAQEGWAKFLANNNISSQQKTPITSGSVTTIPLWGWIVIGASIAALIAILIWYFKKK